MAPIDRHPPGADPAAVRHRRGGSSSGRARVGAALGVLAAGLPALVTWGFTVDDALVTARVAQHLRSGLGYRFNAAGPTVDAVTPLGWAHLLALFPADGVWATWQVARALGLGGWLLAAGWLGHELGARGGRQRLLPLVVLATSAPVAAWSGAGMETGVVTALATIALARSRIALLAAGLAAAWRPELLPWAATLSLGSAWAAGDLATRAPRPGRLALLLAAGLGPAILVACWRVAWFGSPAPLSVTAKSPDLAHGLYYLAAAALWTGVPALLFAPWSLARAPRRVRVVAAALVVHGVAVAMAGGDWMPLFRLVVPVIPSAVLVAAELTALASVGSTLSRVGIAATTGLVLLVARGAEFRSVAERRLALMGEARPLLARAGRVAGLDVGWLGALGSFEIVDLAGITDPSIAVLPGGHTTRRVPHDLVDARDVDHVVLLLAPGAEPGVPWARTVFARGVEARVGQDAFERGFVLVGTVPLPGTEQRYLIAARTPP